MRGILAAAAMFLAAPSLAAPPPGAAAAVDAFHAALHRGDARSAALLISEDALVFEEGQAERSKREYEAEHLAADAEFSRAVSTQITRRTGGGSGMLAWVATEGRTTGTFRGKAVDRRATETMVLRRAGRAWKIVHIHWSSAAAH